MESMENKQALRFSVRTVGGSPVGESENLDEAKRCAFAYAKREGGSCEVFDVGTPFVRYSWDNKGSMVRCESVPPEIGV